MFSRFILRELKRAIDRFIILKIQKEALILQVRMQNNNIYQTLYSVYIQ